MTLASQNKMWWLALFAMLIVILLAFPAEASRMLDENVKVNRGPNFERLNFGMLPRGAIVPPSGPSRGLSPGTPPLSPHRPRPENVRSERIKFGMLPRGAIVPPSGPSRGLSPGTPPLPPHRPRPENVRSERIKFGMLPRGAIVPPSGPSRGLSPGTPPLPPHRPENVNFGMIPKILQKTPPSGPSHRTSDPPPPPSRSERIN